MAFNDQEKQIIIWGKQNGKSADDIQTAIAKLRAGITPQADQPAADQQPTQSNDFFSRVSTDLTKRGNDIAATLSTPARTPSEAAKLGTQAVSQGFGSITDILAEAIRSVPGGSKALDAIGGATSGAFKAITDKLSNTKFFQEAAMGLPDNNPLENTLSAAANVGNTAGDILALDGAAAVGERSTAAASAVKDATAAGLNKAGNAATRVASNAEHVVRDLVPSTQRIINEQVSKALDLTPGDLGKIQKSTGNDVGTWLSDNNLIGKNKTQTQELVDHFFNTSYKQVRDEIGKVATEYKPNQVPRFTDALKQIQARVNGVAGLEQVGADVDNLLHKNTLSLSDVQRVKEMLDEHFNVYKVTGDVGESTTKQGLDNIRTELKQFIENQVKDATGADIKQLNNNVATARTIKDTIVAREPRGLTRGNLKLGDLGIFGIGSAYGTPLTGLALLFGKKLIEAPSIRLRIARYLDGLSDAKKAKLQSELEAGNVPKELSDLTTNRNK